VIKPFISSTYRDLVDHRRAVFDALMKAGYHPLTMEYFGSQPEDATTVSLETLGQCDVFIGIYAFRYGYRPQGGLSITEQEYRAARGQGKDCLTFIVSETYREGLLEEHAEKDADSRAHLERFKDEVMQSHVCARFTTPYDLAVQLATSMDRWAKSHTLKSNPAGLPSGGVVLNGPNYGVIIDKLEGDLNQTIGKFELGKRGRKK
jgi:hypothetical protein